MTKIWKCTSLKGLWPIVFVLTILGNFGIANVFCNDYGITIAEVVDVWLRMTCRRRDADIMGEDLVSRPGCLVPEDRFLYRSTGA